MLRATVLLLALCAAYVHGLGFVNTQLLPETLLAGSVTTAATASLDRLHLDLFQDLVYRPTNVQTALPLRNLVLLDVFQADGVNPLDVHSNLRSNKLAQAGRNYPTNPIVTSTSVTGVVVSIGPGVRQRDLLTEGRRVVFDTTGCFFLRLNGLYQRLCPERNILGALDTGVSGRTTNSADQTFINANSRLSPSFGNNAFSQHDMFF